MGVLRNVRHELYAQAIASGISRREAAAQAGYSPKSVPWVVIEKRPEVKGRIDELLRMAAARSELSRKDILDRIIEDWNLARKLGQTASALKAAELYGRDVHHMFTERKEVGGPGDFDGKSEEELRKIISDDMKSLGWEDDIIPDSNSSIN